MIEQHTLISTRVGSMDAHAYMACRFATEVEVRACEGRAGERLGVWIKELVPAKAWLPMIMITPLGNGKSKWTRQVQAILRRNAGNEPEVLSTLANFAERRHDYVFTAWFMESANEDSEALMEIH
jgi:hypothetical protein